MFGQLILGGVLLWLTYYGGGPALTMLLDLLYPNEQEVVHEAWKNVEARYQAISSVALKRLEEMRKVYGVNA